jgi:CO/xanthine dehydrogenase Mo-binding subunit
MSSEHEPQAPPATLSEPEYRFDGRDKVTGTARYAADAARPGMLWAAFRRSDVPHARLVRVDTDPARAMPGVRAVLTGDDLGGVLFGRMLLDQPVLASDRVLFVGERIAAVAADTRALAEEAARRIEVEYEELRPILSPEDALAPDAPLLHPEASAYVYLGGKRPQMPHPNIQGRRAVALHTDELAERFRSAPHVFEHTFTTPRQHQGYIEPHACLVWLDEDEVVHVITTNKTPFLLREQMAATLGLPQERIDVDADVIGGDFGGKGYSPDEYACYYLARASRRPVKAVMSYVDELAAASPRHAATMRLRTAVDDDGRFLAHEARLIFDGGAYAAAKPVPTLSLGGGIKTMAPYRIPASAIEQLVVYTNSTPGGHMRAPGEVQALFAGESHVDMIARELGIDPIELRLRNVTRNGELGATGVHARETRGADVLEALREHSNWANPLPPRRGRGVAIGVRHVGVGEIGLRVRFDAQGRITVLTGMPDQGGGVHTVIQRVLAVSASVALDRVLVRRASTAEAPADTGVGASRSTHVGSQAAARAGRALKEALEAAAFRTLGESAEPLELVDDWLVAADGAVRMPLTSAAAALVGSAGEILVEARYDSDLPADGHPDDFNYAGYVAEVEVDIETGAVRVLGVTLAADVGTIVNPISHQGQLTGGFAFGIGAALLEDLVVEGGRVQTLNLGDYKLPTTMDMPPLRTVLLPTRVGPGAFGAKMAGEVANTAVAPAIANAIHDAVGVRLHRLPLTAERIHAALRRAAATG